MSSTTKRKRSSKAAIIFPFTQLPKEIQSTIIELACRLPPLPNPSTSIPTQGASTSRIPPEVLYEQKQRPKAKRLPVDLDMKTTLSLTLVSRTTYSQVVPTLYSHVFIARPSALQQLQVTFASRPQLGLFVKSLHLGPADSKGEKWDIVEWMPESEDPSDTEDLIPHLFASLSSVKAQDLAPQWYNGEPFPLLASHQPPDCRRIAISKAVAAAQKAIDVNVCAHPQSYSGKAVGSDLWTLRKHEVQAALDLYLSAMRRCEEQQDDYNSSWRAKKPSRPGPYPSDPQAPQPCQDGSCGHYPALQITGRWGRRRISPQKSTDLRTAVVIDRSELLDHMARPGASTDRFDCPLLFLHSCAWLSNLAWNGRAGGNADDDRGRGDGLEPSSLNSDIESGDWGGDDYVLDDINVPLPATSKIKTLQALARSVLSFVPNISNLSVSGVFERIVCGMWSPPELPSLDSLSVGPVPPHWRTYLRFDHAPLARVKRLRLAGMMLEDRELSYINKHLGQLEKLEWVMADRFNNRHSISLINIIQGLLGNTHTHDENALSAAHSPGHTEEDVDAAEADSSKPLPLIEVQLHTADVAIVLARAPDAETREAWTKGLPVAGQKRALLVRESEAAKHGVSRKDLGDVSGGWGVLYEEGREWWSREARV